MYPLDLAVVTNYCGPDPNPCLGQPRAHEGYTAARSQTLEMGHMMRADRTAQRTLWVLEEPSEVVWAQSRETLGCMKLERRGVAVEGEMQSNGAALSLEHGNSLVPLAACAF